MLAPATIPAPEMVGLLVWWSVVLAAPVVALRRRRRRGAASHPSRRSVLRRPHDTPRWRTAEPSSEQRTAPGRPVWHPTSPSSSGPVTEAASGPTDRMPGPRVPQPVRRRGVVPPQSRCSLGCRPGRLSRCAGTWTSGAGSSSPSASSRQAGATASRSVADRAVPLTGERRNTLLIMGETGIFVISATYAPGHWDDVIAVNRLAGKIQWLLPGYSGRSSRGLPPVCRDEPKDLASPGRARRVGRRVADRWRLGDRVARALRL